MIILIPLGGLGERFKKLGFDKPKPLINVMGKPIIFWLLDNLDLTNVEYVLIPYNKELSKYRFEDLLKNKYSHINFIFHQLNKNTDGAAETINIALSLLNIKDMPILCLDGDNFYYDNIISKWNGKNRLFVFEDIIVDPIYSYIKINDKQVVDIKEKTKISDLAITGGYGFNSWKLLKKYTKELLISNIKEKNEFYTSLVVKLMINDSIYFDYQIVDKNNFICLGTPLQVRMFCNNYPVVNTKSEQVVNKLRICFDLDNTLVTFPKIKGDYTSVMPIENNIKMLKFLKKMGHTIIIYTARNMKTQSGNIGKVMSNIGKITFDTLDKFDIPYDEIYFGKPYADYYIDDLAISCFTDLEKQLGFYNSSVNPRDFNMISSKTIDIIKKQSNNLDGEINWYNNIPENIKDMFPIMISYDENMKWYEMEKINGVTVSKLYLSQEVTLSQFQHILNSINRIHESNNNFDNIDIYSNYVDKLKCRYADYDYSRFNDSEMVYHKIINKLNKYINKKMGKIAVIHGDTVLTNIIINQFGKIKFIDMKGKYENTVTIFGDEFYDWAKLYQSLVGYDEIHENTHIDINYKNSFIEYFKNYFINKYNVDYWEYLQYLTASLLFSLIPLHDNDKCELYYQLIFNLI